MKRSLWLLVAFSLVALAGCNSVSPGAWWSKPLDDSEPEPQWFRNGPAYD